jgi:hypothetical protein
VTALRKLPKAVTFAAGQHEPQEKIREACIMEAVAWVAREPWSDHPECACPVISSFLRSWNDGLPSDADRDRLLRPLVERLVGSRGSGQVESTRSWMALDWLIRVQTPTWLELAGLRDQAEKLRRLDPVLDSVPARSAQPDLDAARAAAWAAAGAAAWAAARAAAGAAAWAAARDAAWAAARDAAGAAAWAAARDAAGDAAWAAARDAAGDAAGDAARAAAWAAAWAAARAAAGDALDPTVRELQQSALKLIDQMLEAS